MQENRIVRTERQQIMPILACGGCIKDLFVTDEELIERFTGKELWLWGSGNYGRLGNNTAGTGSCTSSPVQTVSGGNNWRSVSLNQRHSAAIKTDGTLWLWGQGNYGILGTNNLANRSSPVQTVSGGTNWRSVSLGTVHSAAIKTDGTLWLWGLNAITSARCGFLGDGTTTNRSSPVQTVSGGTDWKSVSLGCEHSAAIKTDGTLWLWGRGLRGILGDDTTTSVPSPVQTVSGGTDWRQVSLGESHSAAIKTDGTLWLWGDGTNGILGDDTTTDKSSPVQTVSGGTNWRQVSLGACHSAAIKTDGTLWLWGRGLRGILGDDTTTNKSSPVQTVSGGANWRQVSLGEIHSAAIKTDGTLWLWGCAGSGRLGDGTSTDKSSPVQTISGGAYWRSASLGSATTSATKVI